MQLNIIWAAVAAAALGLGACSGEKADKGDQQPIKASEAKGDEIGEVYVQQLNRIADAMETVTDEASARAAAKVISESSQELLILGKAIEEMPEAKATAMFVRNARKMSKPNIRIAESIQKIRSEHPEYMEIIEDELRKMPVLQN